MKKIMCQNCKSKRFKPITGISIGNPLKKSQANYILKQCVKCGYRIATQTKVVNGRKIETILKDKPRQGLLIEVKNFKQENKTVPI